MSSEKDKSTDSRQDVSGKNALEVTGFSFSYPDAEPLLENVDLSLAEGSFVLLTGATGSGKTTLLRCIKPELAPAGKRTGSIQVFGRDVTDLDVSQSSASIGYVAQNPENQIVCDSVWHELAFGLENLGIEPDTMRRRIAEVAYFFGIESLMHEQTATLSGGQKQAITLASILAMQPKLLLLDEPTAQLDPIAEKNFLHALFRINRELGITVLVVTHTPETMVGYATDAYRMRKSSVESIDLSQFAPVSLEMVENEISRGMVCATRDDADGVRDENDESKQCFFERQDKKRRDKKEHAILLHDVFFRYASEQAWVMRGTDLVVAPRSIHAIVGGNGSGKSTLLQLIAGTLKPQRGRIKNSLLAKQAFLPQNAKALFVCDSVLEELEEWQHSAGYTDEEVSSLVKRFDLGALLDQHPYDLSGGQQQKLALTKLLLTKPSLLLLDEPTKGLDADSKLEIADILCRQKAVGTTIVLVTHDLSFISRVADSATMIFDGQAVCTESIKEFFTRNIFYRPRVDEFILRRDAQDSERNPDRTTGVS